MIDYDDWSEKPLPVVDPESETYWEAADRGELVVQRCDDCGERQLYPRRFCRHCWSGELDFEAIEGGGTVHTYTRCHVPGQSGYEDDTPYLIALVEIDLPAENPSGRAVRLVSHLVDLTHDAVSVGDRVQVTFRTVGEEEISLPVFEAAD